METDDLVLHAHTYSTSIDSFLSKSGLRDEMIVTQTDIWRDDRKKNVSSLSQDGATEIEFISAMEHWRYPLFTSMYHPEY